MDLLVFLAALWPADYASWPAASRAGTNSMLMMNERRRRSGHYADGNLRAAGIRECEQYGWMQDRADPRALIT
jgi:hypothetical protein